MSQTGNPPSQKLVTELKVSGHLMTLEAGLFCVFHAPGSAAADPQTGLPGVRITHPPLQDRSSLSISAFNEDGWIGAEAGAALVRVNSGPAQLLVTIYQNAGGQNEAPKLQVMRLGDLPERAPQAAEAAPAPAAAAVAAPAAPEAAAPAREPGPGPAPASVEGAEVAAHVQRRGDRLGKLGEWMGEPGSQTWIEGFAIAPNRLLGPEDIEYQAVLGKGWLSPWSEGGQYCGSRGMALPILGLRVRLRGPAAESHSLQVSATFTDGSSVGPAAANETVESESLAPLEAFRIEIVPNAQDEAAPASPKPVNAEQAAPEPPASEPVTAEPARKVPASPTKPAAGKPARRAADPAAVATPAVSPPAAARTKPAASVTKPAARPSATKPAAAKGGRTARR